MIRPDDQPIRPRITSQLGKIGPNTPLVHRVGHGGQVAIRVHGGPYGLGDVRGVLLPYWMTRSFCSCSVSSRAEVAVSPVPRS